MDSRNCKDLLRSFSHKISNAIYTDWESFLIDLLKSSKTVVFDEFQDFLRTCPYVLSIFQKVWDEYQGEVLLILCGSYSGMMKRVFTDGKSPFFGRADTLINLKPFGFTETLEMLRDFGYYFEEAITWCSIFGGVPKYLWLLKDRKSIEEKIFEVFSMNFHRLRKKVKTSLCLNLGRNIPGISLF